jgi:hypothetical protein
VNNRLYLILSGFFSDEELKAAGDKTIQEAKKLRPGFAVINDISNFKPASAAGIAEVKRAQLFIMEHGAGKVVRVVGPAALTSMQFSRTSKEVGYQADAVASVEEAEKFLKS